MDLRRVVLHFSGMRRALVPTYDLYADPRSYAAPGFLHIERIRTRARPHSWSIKRHRHEAMWQAMLIVSGGGAAMAEGRVASIRPPWFLWMPAGLAHGFDFTPGTEGYVVTASRDLLDASLRREGFGPFSFLRERLTIAELAEADDLQRLMEALMGEHGVRGFGARAAASAWFDLLLVAAARIAGPEGAAPRPTPAGDLIDRYRALIETTFRAAWPLSRYAAELGVTADRLYDAARQAAGRAPQTMLHDRIMIEAKRSLLYTSMTVSEVAYDLGFADPAYFTRFFSRRAGCSPSLFRRLDGRADESRREALSPRAPVL